jgi:hypothetical protein
MLASGGMTGCEVTVHRLRVQEPVQINVEALLAVRQSVGGARGDYVIDLMMNDLLEGLIATEEALVNGDPDTLIRSAGRVVRQSERLGLGQLEHAAAAVLAVAADGGPLPAVVARMIRTGEATISAVWRILSVQARP